ncbi:Rrf2 family transcriptional regulator [Aquisalimonas sp.]|uniref:RrF2 family transcriptional regulator n=1 Tax=Aquisalimonas sp. TaxID=1872621 RepID=UPI0025BB142C|nr:Rrf2 family transcriptional regulator [Aquisalimonas sp.]
MRVTRHTDYAFQALIYMGMTPDEQLSTIGRIAEKYDISRNHLMKVVQKLVQHGYVHSVRGRLGGVRLAVSPRDIRLGEVARVTEAQGYFIECREDTAGRPVPLRHAMSEAMEAFFTALDRYTLHDLLGYPERLRVVRHMQRLPQRV